MQKAKLKELLEKLDFIANRITHSQMAGKDHALKAVEEVEEALKKEMEEMDTVA